MSGILGPIVTYCQGPIVPRPALTLWAMPDATSPERMAFAARLIELCNAAGLPVRGRQTKLAELFKVTPKAARKWVSGLGLPELELIIKIARWGNVNVEWLVSGRGPKRGNLVDTKDLMLGEMVKNLPAATRHEIADFLGYKIERGIPTLAEEERARYMQIISTYKNGPT